jgi:cobalt-zinc-cadmium efflux system outer membrane protein
LKRHSFWKLLLQIVLLFCVLPISVAAQNNSAIPGFTLQQLEQIALENNPTLAEARAEVKAAAGRTHQAGMWPNPTVGYTGDEIRGGSFGGGQHGIFVQQDVILGGKLDLDRKISVEEGKQTQAAAEEQILRVKTGVRVAFYKSLAAQQMVEMRQKLNALAHDAVETTRQLFNVGQADRPDLLQAEVEADQTELAVVAEQQEQRRAWQSLAAMIGKPEITLSRLEGNLENLPELNPEEILQTILRDSPAVKNAQLEIARADAALTRAHRAVVPDLSIRAGYAGNLEQLGTIPPRAVGSEGFAEVGVNIPLFNRNQGNIEAASAERERASLEVQRVSLALRQRAAAILESYVSLRAAVDVYKTRMLPNARQAHQLFLQKYRQGAAAYPQVLIAQRTLFELEAQYLAALENVWINAATLEGFLLTDGLDAPSGASEIGSSKK